MDTITIQDVFGWMSKYILQILLFVGIFVEITPIKFNPISWLAGILFKPLRKDMEEMKKKLSSDITKVKDDLMSEINQIKEEQMSQKTAITDIIKENDMNEITRIRWDIKEFASSIDNNIQHSRDEYRHIIDSNRRYHSLIEKYKMENGMVDDDMEKILAHYNDHKNNNEMFF